MYAKDLELNDCKKILIVPTEVELNVTLLQKFDDYISLAANNQIITLRLNTYIRTIFQSQNLQINQNKYKQLVEQFGDSVILLDKDGTICEVNSHFCKVARYSEQELLTSNIQKVFPDSFFLENVYKTNDTSSLIETFLYTSKGELVSKEIRISQIILDNKPFYLVIARDMRERLKSLKKLEESEERFRTVIKHSPNGMIIFKNDVISYINLFGLKIFGGTYEDFIDQSFFRLVVPAHKLELQAFIKKSTKSELPASKDFTFIDLRGQEISLNLNSIPIDVHGEIHHFVIFQDLTEQKRTQYDLETKDLRLREIQKIAKLGHWENNLLKNNLYWSDEVYKIYGVKPHSFFPTYNNSLDFVHPDDRETVKNAYQTSIKNREPYEIVHRIVLADGSIKYVNEKCSTIYDDARNPLRSLGTVMDITHTIKTEKALRQTEEKFRLLFENLDEPFLICKPKYEPDGTVEDFVISELNPACKRLFRGNYLEVKEHTIKEIFHDASFWIQKYVEAFEKSETISFRKYSTDLHKYFDVVLLADGFRR
jgi:PAS domain S-box-containing protein